MRYLLLILTAVLLAGCGPSVELPRGRLDGSGGEASTIITYVGKYKGKDLYKLQNRSTVVADNGWTTSYMVDLGLQIEDLSRLRVMPK